MYEGNYDKCPHCKEWAWLGSHHCAPVWDVVVPDYGDPDEPDHAFGHSEETAVESYAGMMFSHLEYPEDFEIWIREGGSSDDWHKYDIHVVPVPSFEISRKSEKYVTSNRMPDL